MALTFTGMFLWVRLILGQLEDDVYSLHDLETAVADMPVGLNDLLVSIAIVAAVHADLSTKLCAYCGTSRVAQS
jgi:hypothetical protein